MDKYFFGNSITRTFFALQNGEPINLPSQAPALYLFSGQPSFDAASLGTGAAQTLSYWTHDNVSPFPRSYTWNAVNDPTPGSTTGVTTYWEGINFVNQLTKQVQTLIRPLLLERVESLDSIPGTSVTDIKAVYPKVSAYLSDSELANHLSIAVEEFKLDLEARGIEYHQAFQYRKAKYAIAYLAISMSSLSQIQDINDKHYIRWEAYEAKYRAMLEKIQLPVDFDGDNLADDDADLKTTVIVNER